MATGKEFEVTEVGINTPKQLPVDELTVGDVGYILLRTLYQWPSFEFYLRL
jgi:translation elongation factor EF-4